MKKAKVEEKELTIEDLKVLWQKHTSATSEEQKELWKNETEYNKLLLTELRNSYNTCYKVLSDKLLINDLWDKDVNNMNYALRKYNINEFVLIKNSSMAMDVLISFIQLGWEVVGTEEYALDERYNFEEHQKYYLPKTGLLLKRKEDK